MLDFERIETIETRIIKVKEDIRYLEGYLRVTHHCPETERLLRKADKELKALNDELCEGGVHSLRDIGDDLACCNCGHRENAEPATFEDHRFIEHL